MAAIIDPAQVQVDGAAPLVGREIRHTLEHADPRVVDQIIQAAETRIHALEEAPHIFQFGDVGGFRQQTAVRAGLAIFQKSLDVLGHSAAYGYRRAFPQQALRDGASDSPRAACYNRNFAG